MVQVVENASSIIGADEVTVVVEGVDPEEVRDFMAKRLAQAWATLKIGSCNHENSNTVYPVSPNGTLLGGDQNDQQRIAAEMRAYGVENCRYRNEFKFRRKA